MVVIFGFVMICSVERSFRNILNSSNLEWIGIRDLEDIGGWSRLVQAWELESFTYFLGLSFLKFQGN